jgi:predicted transcriptional regulator of viral defense system
MEFMIQNTQLKPARFAFPYRPVVRYTWGDVPLYALLLSLRPGAYLTHSTAMYFHRLTDQAPKVINLNVEQTPKPHYASSELTQDRIDFAFENPTRMSHNVAEYGGYEIRMLNGLHTGNVGVMEMPGPEGEALRITDVERTLIDIAVRPEYSGGVFDVLEAYKRAAEKVSIKKLTGHLKSINYIYPYHQAIGFYLTKAGSYRRSQICLLRKFEISYDFYLAHQIRERDYSSEWRLFYPKGLD